MTKIETTAEKLFAQKLEDYKASKIVEKLNLIAKYERELENYRERQKAELKLIVQSTEETIASTKEMIEAIKKETFIPEKNGTIGVDFAYGKSSLRDIYGSFITSGSINF